MTHTTDRDTTDRQITDHQITDHRTSDDHSGRGDPTVPRLLLTPLQAGAALGISRTRVFALLASGELESVQLGRSRRIPVAALEEFVGRLRQVPGDAPHR